MKLHLNRCIRHKLVFAYFFHFEHFASCQMKLWIDWTRCFLCKSLVDPLWSICIFFMFRRQIILNVFFVNMKRSSYPSLLSHYPSSFCLPICQDLPTSWPPSSLIITQLWWLKLKWCYRLPSLSTFFFYSSPPPFASHFCSSVCVAITKGYDPWPSGSSVSPALRRGLKDLIQ